MALVETLRLKPVLQILAEQKMELPTGYKIPKSSSVSRRRCAAFGKLLSKRNLGAYMYDVLFHT